LIGVRFTAPEHRADGSIGTARYEIEGAPVDGWRVRREGRAYLAVGAGYRLLRSRVCGICATDLARHRLPFPLPQVTGHEAVAEADDGTLVAVEINASHAARELPRAQWCEPCRSGLPTHCADRPVLGIHGLLGGFSPWILAPTGAAVPLPRDLDPLVATLLEPFAAAWHAVGTIAPRPGDCVAVLGPGRLGTLTVAALAAYRQRRGIAFGILVLAREPARAELARAVGADEIRALAAVPRGAPVADVVIDTTGAAVGLETALALACREVHVKSTSGEPACGLRHVTELVVDELRLVPDGAPGSADDAAVRVTSLPALEAAIRPDPAVARAAVGPRGTIVVGAPAPDDSPLLDAIAGRGLIVSSSRCGDLRDALPVLCELVRTTDLARLVTAVVAPEHLAVGYALARQAGAGKIVVRQPA
jgi:threonine dehydrogenase-like Zn-dependent dehydrogenase